MLLDTVFDTLSSVYIIIINQDQSIIQFTTLSVHRKLRFGISWSGVDPNHWYIFKAPK